MEECAEQEVVMPDSIQHQINEVNSDWEKLQGLMDRIKPVTDNFLEEVLTQGKLFYLYLQKIIIWLFENFFCLF